jgi:hypothetical protein
MFCLTQSGNANGVRDFFRNSKGNGAQPGDVPDSITAF